MRKILLTALLLSMTLTAAASDDATPPSEAPEVVVVRTGTCGATTASVERNCKSVGINVKTGEIVMSVDADGKDVWTKGSAVVVGQLATQSNLDAANERITDNASRTYQEGVLRADSDFRLLKGIKIVRSASIQGDERLTVDLNSEIAARILGDKVAGERIDTNTADIATAVANSIERDIAISANVAVNKAGVATNASAIALTNTELSTVSGKVDANKFAHDNLEVRVKQADIHLVETNVLVHENTQGVLVNKSSIDGLRDYSRDNRAAIASNNSHIDWNRVSIGNLQHDINRLDGQIAAQVAASASIMPSNWDGRFAVTVGVGSYRGQTGLALGIMHDNGDWAIKAQVTGTDEDNWSDLAVGASVGFAF